MGMTHDDDLITVTEAAQLLGYQNQNPTASVWNLVQRGVLEKVANPGLAGHRFLLRRGEVLAYRQDRLQALQRQLNKLQPPVLP